MADLEDEVLGGRALADGAEGQPRTAACHTGIGAVLRRELRRFTVDPLYICLLLVFPVAGIGFVAGAFSARTPVDLPVALHDADRSVLSRQAARWIDATQGVAITRQVTSPGAGREAIMRGEVYALVLLPEDFERDALSGRSARVVAYVNGQWLGPGNVIARDVRMATMTLSTGVVARTLQTLGIPSDVAYARAMPVSVAQGALFNPGLDYVAYLVVALVPAFMAIFVVSATVHAVGSELRRGTAGELMEMAGGSVAVALGGKLAPHALAFVIVTVAIIAGLLSWFRIPVVGSAWTILLGVVVFVAACTGIGLAVVIWTANLRLAMSVAAFYTGPAFAFSGVSFPRFDMPPAAHAWALLLPGTHLIDILRDQVTIGAPPSASLASVLALAAFALAGLALALARAGRVLRDPVYWGRT